MQLYSYKITVAKSETPSFTIISISCGCTLVNIIVDIYLKLYFSHSIGTVAKIVFQITSEPPPLFLHPWG